MEIMKALQQNAQIDPVEKQEAIRAYFSISGLFKNMVKNKEVVAGEVGGSSSNGGKNGQ